MDRHGYIAGRHRKARRCAKPPLALLALALLAFALLGGCSAPRGKGLNVVFVTLDTLNIWQTGLFDPQLPTTPNLEALAREGLLFEQVYTPVPITLPSHVTIFSGRLPWEHGVFANGDEVPEKTLTLAEILRDEGYRTAAFISLAVLGTQYRLAQGFSDYRDPFRKDSARWYRFADEVLEPVPQWLDARGSDPFFLWVHLSDPHEPYAVKDAAPDVRVLLGDEVLQEWNLTQKHQRKLALRLPPGAHTLRWESIRVPRHDDRDHTRLVLKLLRVEQLLPWFAEPSAAPEPLQPLTPSFALDLFNPGSEPEALEVVFNGLLEGIPPSEVEEQYAAEVAYLDRHLGLLRDLISRRGLDEETIWVVASDHGEGLYHHGILGHADYVQEDQMRALWLLAGPGIPAQRRLDGPVLTRDILPTLLDLLELPIPPQVSGRSRRSCWTATCRFEIRWPVYSVDTEHRLASVGLYRWPRKALIDRLGQEGVFALESDPREEANLLRRRAPTEKSEILEQLRNHRQAFVHLLAAGSERELSSEERTMLESLGYL